MIIKPAAFKKLLKEAWESTDGLYIEVQADKNMIIAGSWWSIEIRMADMIPKELAALIEIVGRIPGEGESIRVFPDGEEECLVKGIRKPEEQYGLGSDKYKQTYILTDTVKGCVRAYQNCKDNSLIWVQEGLIKEIGKVSIKGEGVIREPKYYGNSLIWKSETSFIQVYRYDVKKEELERLLGNMELYAG